MSMNSLTLPAAELDVKAVIMADSSPVPVYEYQDGKKTEAQKVHPQGWAIFALRDVAASIAGEAATIRLETGSDKKIPAGAILAPAGPVELTVRAQAASSSYATLAITVSCEHWGVQGNALAALGVATEQPSSHKSKIISNTDRSKQ